MKPADQVLDSLSACPCAEPLMYVAFLGGCIAGALIVLVLISRRQ